MQVSEKAPSPDRPADEVVAWFVRRFPQASVAVTTGFGMEGCVLIDILARHWRTFEVFYLDTHFLFPETHQVRQRLEARFPQVRFVNAGTSLTAEEQARRFGPELWRFSPDLCCHLRKVDPMRVLLQGRKAWITALRRTSAPTRAALAQISWDRSHGLFKVSPLAAWNRRDVRAYVAEHRLPYNALYDRGYPSIGCTHCTHPVPSHDPNDDTRSGRWTGTGKTECGLHMRAGPIPAERGRSHP